MRYPWPACSSTASKPASFTRRAARAKSATFSSIWAGVIATLVAPRYMQNFAEAPSGRVPITDGLEKKPQCTSWTEAAAPAACTLSENRLSCGASSGRAHSSWANPLPSADTAR